MLCGASPIILFVHADQLCYSKIRPLAKVDLGHAIVILPAAIFAFMQEVYCSKFFSCSLDAIMKARYRYRLYPTSCQQVSLAKLFGCTRVVWNDALAHCIEEYRAGNKKPSNGSLQKQFITQAKQTSEREWLGEVSNIALQQSLNDLDQAYQNFFKSCKGERKGKPVRPPKFKKRKGRQSAKFHSGGFKVQETSVYIAKIGKIKTIWSRELPTKPTSATVIKDPAGRYFVSFVVEVQPEPLPPTTKSCGIDLGIIDFATFDDGRKVKAPKPLRKNLRRLRKRQKKLSRTQKGSKRREVARKKVAKLHAKIKDTRTDFLHKLSTKVVKENQLIALEDLNVSGLLKNRTPLYPPSGGTQGGGDLGWREFRTLLEAKADKYGREFRVINRWEPTSQLCSCCGQKGGKKDLSIREWTCLWCGSFHDRDANAATNILKVAGGQPKTAQPKFQQLELFEINNFQVAGGQSETQNGRGGRRKTFVKGAAANEASTHPKFRQLNLFE